MSTVWACSVFLSIIFTLAFNATTSRAFAAPKQSTSEEPTPLRLQDSIWPPYFIPDERGGAHKGLVKDVLSHCLKSEKIPHHYEYVPIKRLFVLLEEGSLDIAVMGKTKERESFLQFGNEPIFNEKYSAFVRFDAPFQINKVADFGPLRIGHILGLPKWGEFGEFLEKSYKTDTIASVPNPDNAIQMLTDKRIDVFTETSRTVWWIARELRMEHLIREEPYVIRELDYYFAIARASPRVKDRDVLLNSLDQCVKELKRSGEMDTILKRYERAAAILMPIAR